MTHLRNSLFLFIALASANGLSAQITFTAKASQKVVGQQDIFEVEYTLNGESGVDQFIQPSFSPFQVVQGPSYTSGFNLINGTASKYYSVSYFLRPTSEGKFSLAPASVMVDNQTVYSNPLNLEVVKGSTGGGASSAPSGPLPGMGGPPTMDPFAPAGRDTYGDQYLRKNDKAEDKIKHNMLLKMSASKTSCYVGEPVVATCKLYSRLESESKVVDRPSFSGFSVFEMTQPEQGTVSREVMGGKPYNSYLIRKAQLYPLQSGDLTIEPVQVDNNVVFYREGKSDRTQAPAGSVFDQMMRDFWGDASGPGVPEKHQLTLSTEPLVIHVKPLPLTGKPDDFTGAVGQFTLQSSLAGTSLTTNETDTLLLVVSGTGNLPMINAPTLQWPSGLESYDPSAKEQLDQTISPIKGRKIFQYVFTAGKAGDYTMSPVSFSYFDPQSGAYKTIRTEPLLLKVLPGKGDTKTITTPVGEVPGYHLPLWLWLLCGLLFMGLIIAGMRTRSRRSGAGGAIPHSPSAPDQGGFQKAREQPLPDPAYAGLAKAGHTPRDLDKRVQQMAPSAVTTYEEKDWLEEARTRLKENNPGAYYRALNAGIWGFLQEHLGLRGDRNKTLVMERMEQKGFSPFVREETRQLLEECELALYAAIQTTSDMQRSMDMSERLQKRFLHNLTE